MLREPFSEQCPAARVLLLELNAGCALGVKTSEPFRPPFLKSSRDLLRILAEGFLVLLLGSVPCSCDDGGQHAFRMAQRSMHAREGSHGEPHDVSLLDACRTHHIDDVVSGACL